MKLGKMFVLEIVSMITLYVCVLFIMQLKFNIGIVLYTCLILVTMLRIMNLLKPIEKEVSINLKGDS